MAASRTRHDLDDRPALTPLTGPTSARHGDGTLPSRLEPVTMAHAPMSPSDSWRRLAPERVAALASAIVLALGGLGVASTMGAAQGENARPSVSPGSAAPVGVALATAHPFASTAELALGIHKRLAEDQQMLKLEVAASEIDIAAVVSTVRRLNATARLGGDVAKALSAIPGSSDVGVALLAFYRSVAEAADETLSKSVVDRVAYRAAAKRLLASLEPTAALQERLEALIESARGTPGAASAPSGVAGSAAATPVPATAVPTRTVPPTARPTASPTTPPPTVPPSGPLLLGQIRNPGFEALDPRPWALTLESPAVASLTVDSTAPAFEGERSARVDISVSSDARTGVTLQQAGIDVAASQRYICRVALRAAADREVRVRVASASGATYGTRLVTIGSAWTVIEFEFGSFVQDPAAVINIDLGRSPVTTWVDAVQITEGSVAAP